MITRPPIATRTDTLVPYTTLFRSTAQGWPAPTEARLLQLDLEILGTRGDAQPLLRHETGEVRRFRDRLYLLPHLPRVPEGEWCWPTRRRAFDLPDGLGHLKLDAVPTAALRVSFARGGERLKPAGQVHTRKIGRASCGEKGG